MPEIEEPEIGRTPNTSSIYPRFVRLKRLFTRIQKNEEVILVITSAIVGIGAGIGAVIFRFLIQVIETVGYDWFPSLLPGLGKSYVVLVPAVGGLLVGCN